MNNESKMIVASNLTIAVWLREQSMMQSGGEPTRESKQVIMEIFKDMLFLLEKQYPEDK